MWKNDAGLAGKSVVTGAAGGIGRSVVKGFAEAGCKVLLVDIPGSPLREVYDSLSEGGHEIYAVDLSVISSSSLDC
jgi:NAD(P)-dependent dehydrogenase (short-subunit alcohol dehydrogenase family)